MPKRGRPPMTPALTKFLYVRISDDLASRLKRRAQEECDRKPGHTITVADVVREVLLRELGD